MYTHMQHTGARIFVLSQIFLKIQRFEIGEMEVEHPVQYVNSLAKTLCLSNFGYFFDNNSPIASAKTPIDRVTTGLTMTIMTIDIKIVASLLIAITKRLAMYPIIGKPEVKTYITKIIFQKNQVRNPLSDFSNGGVFIGPTVNCRYNEFKDLLSESRLMTKGEFSF